MFSPCIYRKMLLPFSLLFAGRLKELFAITTLRFVSLKAEYKKKAGNDLAQASVFISAPVCHLRSRLQAMMNISMSGTLICSKDALSYLKK